MNSEDSVAILLETFTWLGIGIGAVSFVILMLMRAVDGPWIPTSAVLVPDTDPVEARWMTLEGTLHTRILDPHEGEELGMDDAATVYYCRRDPYRMRFSRRGHSERILGILALLFGVLGAACFVGALVFAFAQG